MAHADVASCADGLPARLQVNVPELRRLAGIGVRHADQVYKRVGRRYALAVGFSAQGVAVHHIAARGKLCLRAGPRQCPHTMSSPQQLRRQPASHEAGSSGNEHFSWLRIHLLPQKLSQPPILVRELDEVRFKSSVRNYEESV